jgi:Flp pilus assembly protein TadG
MLSPLIHRAGKHRKDARSKERGVTLALVAAAMVAIIGMAALSIDIGTLYQAKAEAQRAADAAALAAARVISISGITGDPDNTSGGWVLVCGPGGTATLAALQVAQVVQWNFVGGAPASKVTVGYGAGGSASDCSTLAGKSFAVNPTVTVYVQQASVATFFGRIFALIPGGTSANSGVSATASAEVFNPSGSGAYAPGGNVVPVWPRCVKPWIVPDADPVHPGLFVNQLDGTIVSPGISPGGVGAGVIGENFNLVADCNAGGTSCTLTNQPQANVGTAAKPNLQYVPALVSSPSPAASSSCPAANDYQQAIAGCDNTTPYQCGAPSAPTPLDLGQNPFGAGNESATAAECLIRASGTGAGTGQDLLVTNSIPFQIQAGSANPILGSGVTGGSAISSSTSIVSLPIYQSTTLLTGAQNQEVTIIGFLQVFINEVNADGSLNVTVLNVSGCSNTWTGGSASVTGTSPVPVRLITPP